MNRIIDQEGLSGLKQRIRNYQNVEAEGRSYVKSLGSAGDNMAWLHGPDMRVGGGPRDIIGIGGRRENSILGGQAGKIAQQILELPDNVTRITAKFNYKNLR